MLLKLVNVLCKSAVVTMRAGKTEHVLRKILMISGGDDFLRFCGTICSHDAYPVLK